jgi:hypothetical protein
LIALVSACGDAVLAASKRKQQAQISQASSSSCFAAVHSSPVAARLVTAMAVRS